MRTILPLTVILAASGCGGAEPATSVTEPRAAWVGAIDGTDARMGLVREGAHVTAYICGGPTTLSTTRWFRGDVRSDGTIELASDGATLRATSSNSGWSGTFVGPSDPARTFSVSAVQAGTADDLYEGSLDGGSVGVVVAGDSMQGVFRAVDGSTFQVLPVRTVELAPQGLAVKVVLATGTRELFVQPVRAKL